jgi:hypothetical protein
MEKHETSPFRKINTVFPILKMPQAHEIESIPPKIGEIELEASCSFDPAIKLKLNRNEPKNENYTSAENFQANKLEQKRKELYERKAQDKAVTHASNTGNAEEPATMEGGFFKRNLDPLESAIEKAMSLKNKLLMAETNHNLELDRRLNKDLYDGTGLDLMLDPRSDHNRPHYKESELERLKLALQNPEIEEILGTPMQDGQLQQKYSLEMTDIQKLKLNLMSFHPEHEVLADRIKGTNLVLQVRLPKFYEKTLLDTFEFSLEEKSVDPKEKGEFLVNKEIKNQYQVKDVGVEKLAKSNISFNLLMRIPKNSETSKEKSTSASKPPSKNTKEENPNEKSAFTTLNIAKGAYNLGELLQQKNFNYKGRVYFDSLIGLDRKKNEFKAPDDPKKPSATSKKPKSKPDEALLPSKIGYLTVDLSFINESISLIPLPEPPKPSEHDLILERVANARAKRHITRLQSDVSERGLPLLPVCLFVHVLRAAKIGDRDGSRYKRNLFVQHKLYGTPDDITSPIFWNQSNPEIDHRIVIPLNMNSIDLMKDAPFTISVWDKHDQVGSDELIGTVHVVLKSAYSLLKPLSEEDLRAMLAKQDLNMLELTNKYLAIERLSSCKEAGFLKVYAAVGNIHQVNEYNILHPANNSRMLGVDATAFDFDTDGALLRKRDLARKKRLRLNDLQKTMLERDPAAKHLATTLIRQLNEGEIEMDKFLHELHALMGRHPDVRIVDILKSIERDAELCNPFESIDTSRKNYLRLGDQQLVYDGLSKKYMQVSGEGLRTPLDKCQYRTKEGELQLIFVDPEVVKVKRDIRGNRMLDSKQLAKLKKLGKQFVPVSEAEARALKAMKEEKRMAREAELKAEEERMEREIAEAQQKLEESKAVIKAAKLLEKQIKLKEEKEAEKHKKNLEQQGTNEPKRQTNLKLNIADNNDISPESSQGPKKGSKGWGLVKKNLDVLKKDNLREDESYGSPSHRSVIMTSRSKKEKIIINLGGSDEPEDNQKVGSHSSFAFSKGSPQPDSPRSIFKEQKPEGSHKSGSQKGFNVIQVGMVLNNYNYTYESSEDLSEENLRMKNINLIEKTDELDEYDPTIHIPQYATEIEDDIECSDIILNFTVILEYMRRTIVGDEKLMKNLKYLLLGQFQSQMFKNIAFSDMEYIMEQYSVNTSTSELQSVFDFLDVNKTGTVNLVDIHDSLVAYMLLYRRYQRQYEGTFKYLMDKVHNQEAGLTPLINFLTVKSEKYHIETRKLAKFFRDEYFVHDIDMIESQLREYGEYLYFDQVYIYNILNVLSFMNAAGGSKCDPQRIKGLHHYESFLPLILLKIRERSAKHYGEEAALEKIKEKMTENNQKTEVIQQGSARILRRQTTNEFDEENNKIKNPVKLNFSGFCSLMEDLEFKDLSLYERMILFYFIYDLKLKMRHIIEDNQLLSMQEIYIFFQLVVGENPEEVQKLLGRRIVGSLASFINREKMFELKITPVHSRNSSISGQKRNKLLTRRKMKTDLITTDRVIYRVSVNVQGIEDLNLGAAHDYGDFSLSFTFPGEPAKFESQLFTYIPRETEYDLLLNTEHTFRSSPKLDIAAVFENREAIRLSVNKISKNRSDEVAYCLVPISEILAPNPKSRKYFLYFADGLAHGDTKIAGAVKVALAFYSGPEKLTEKDFFFSKKFMVQDQVVEKEVVFEREVPKKGFLVVHVGSLRKLEGFYNLMDWVKRTCRFSSSNSRFTLSFLIKISEIQKPQTVFAKKKSPGVIEEVLNEESSSEINHRDSNNPIPYEQSSQKQPTEMLFPEYVIELKTSNLGSQESIFAFIDAFASKDVHHIFNTRRFELEITPETLSLLESSDLEIGIYLGCSGQTGYKESKICGKALSCYQFLTVQNLDGQRNDLTLTNDTYTSIKADVDVHVNYSKVFVSELHVEQQNKFKEMEGFLDLLRPLVILADVTQLLTLPQGGPEQVCFVRCQVGDSLVESTRLIPEGGSRQVGWAKLVPEDNRSLLEFRLGRLVEEIKLDELYERYKRAPDAGDIQTFLLGCLPKLKVVLIEHRVDRQEITESATSIDIKVLVKMALESNILPNCIVFKGYVPLESNLVANPGFGDSDEPKDDFLISGNYSRVLRNHEMTEEGHLPDKSELFRSRVTSEKQIKIPEKSYSKPTTLACKRIGLKIYFLSSKGITNQRALDGFKMLLVQPWTKSIENFVKKFSENGNFDQDLLEMKDKGFVVNKEAFKHLISKELGIGLVMANSVIDILGYERQSSNFAKLYHLLCYPLDINQSVQDCAFSEKMVNDLLKEFKHLDVIGSGYVPFGEAVKLVMNFSLSIKVSMKQLQVFKYSDLIKDLRDTLPKPVLLSLEKQGFDYLVFLNELLELNRRNFLKENKNKQFLPLEYHLNQIEKEEEKLVKTYNTLEATIIQPKKDNRMISDLLFIDRKENKYTLTITIEKGTDLQEVATEAFPTTKVAVTSSLTAVDDKIPSSTEAMMSQVIMRDPEPEWMFSFSKEIQNLEQYRKENQDSYVEVEILERCMNPNTSGAGLFNLIKIAKCRVYPFKAISTQELAKFVLSPHQYDLKKDCLSRINSTKATCQITIQLSKHDGNLAATLPNLNLEHMDKDVALIKKTFEEINQFLPEKQDYSDPFYDLRLSSKVKSSEFDQRSDFIEQTRVSDHVRSFKDTMKEIDEFVNMIGTPIHQERLPSVTSFDKGSNPADPFPQDGPKKGLLGTPHLPLMHSNSKCLITIGNYSWRDIHNDTAKFGENSANELQVPGAPTPPLLSKRGSIFLRLEDKTPTTPAFQLEFYGGHFHDPHPGFSQTSARQIDGGSRISIQPGGDSFAEENPEEEGSIEEKHAFH